MEETGNPAEEASRLPRAASATGRPRSAAPGTSKGPPAPHAWAHGSGRESEEWFRCVFEGSRDAIFILDADGRIVDANPAAADLTGYAPEALRALGASDLLDEYSARLHETLLDRVLDGELGMADLRLLRKDRSTVRVELRSRRMTVGGAAYSHTVLRDVPVRTTADRELRAILQVYQLTASATTARELCQWLCSFFRYLTGFDAVGMRLRDGNDFPYYETNGFSEAFIRAESRLCAADEAGEALRDRDGNPLLVCLCGCVLSGRIDLAQPYFTSAGSFWTNSTSDLLTGMSPTDRPPGMRGRCHEAGYETVALIPLRSGQDTTGLLHLKARRRGLLSPGAMAMLECLCGHAAPAVAHLMDQERLRDSEDRYRTFVQSLPGMVYRGTPELKPSFLHGTVEELTGYTAGEFLSGAITWERMIHPDDLPAVRSKLLRLLQAPGQRDEAEFRILRRDGSTRWVREIVHSVADDSGRLAFIQGLVVDVTDRIKSEQTRSLLASIVESSDDAIHCVRLDGTVVAWNRGSEKIYGYTAAEIIGQPIFAIAPPDRLDEMRRLLDQVARGEEINHLETVRCAKDGRFIKVAVSIGPVRDASGRIVAASAIARDVTDQRAAEEALRKSERLRLQAEQQAAVGRMAARIAHEINNPLSGIRNCFWLLKNAIPKYHRHFHFAEKAEREIERIGRIVQGMFDLKRPGRQEVRKVRIADLLSDAEAMFAGKCRDGALQMQWAMDPPDLELRVAEDALRQVLQNLVSNAVEASPPNRAIQIEVRITEDEDARQFELTVKDEGHGIPKELGERIFEPFFSTKTGEGTSGLGLGLAVAKGLVESLGGRLDYRSIPGNGTRFRVRLPYR